MSSIIGKRAATNQTINLFKQSFNLIKSFSTATPTPTPSPAASVSAKKAINRKKKKNLFQVASFLPNWGVGYQLAKSHWVGLSYQITKINLYKDGKHGKAWGIVHKDGSPAADAPKKISGVHKRCWKYIPTKKTIQETLPVEALPAEAA